MVREPALPKLAAQKMDRHPKRLRTGHTKMDLTVRIELKLSSETDPILHNIELKISSTVAAVRKQNSFLYSKLKIMLDPAWI